MLRNVGFFLLAVVCQITLAKLECSVEKTCLLDIEVEKAEIQVDNEWFTDI